MTSTTQLQRWGKKNVKHWGGVHASDQIPPGNKLPPIWNAVINYDPEVGVKLHGYTRDGSHWVQLSRYAPHGPQTATCTFFDSYGHRWDADSKILHETKRRFTPWIKANCPGGCEYNHVQLQAYTGPYNDVCGQFSLYAAQNGLPQNNSQKYRWITRNKNLNGQIVSSLVKI